MQSALAPASEQAGELAALGWIMFVSGAAICLAVTALGAYAVTAGAERRRWLADGRAIIGGGIVFPVVALTALLIYSLPRFGEPAAQAGARALEIEVTGEQYWWRVRYRGEGGQPDIVTANELVVPVGRVVALSLKTADVIHSLWMPNLAGKMDMIPGTTNVLRFRADRSGIYRGQCAEFCGLQHALMAFDVVALEPDAYERWRERQLRPGREPDTPFLQRGLELFLAAGCGSCHAVRGTAARGQSGPDLTHVGSRRSLAAASFPNNVGTLAGWIADAQHLKRGSRMPSYTGLSGEELRAIAAYVDSLK